MIKKTIPIIVILILLSIIISLSVFYSISYQRKIHPITNKAIYNVGDNLTIKIKNTLKDRICFSTCYPYYFEREKEEGIWEGLSYPPCATKDLIGRCLDSKATKFFETKIPVLEKGKYRLAIPLCINCKEGKEFNPEIWLYSNEFIIK